VIARRLGEVQERVRRAAERAGRDPASIALVAVSKGQPADAVREAHAAGQRLFGENYVQELRAKASALSDLADLRWHFIGHLQRNKAKDVAGVVSCVETVGSERLAEALARHAPGPLDVLVQVNVAGEAQKSGCAPAELDAIAERVRRCPPLLLRGLMTVPPFEGDPRPHFRALAALSRARGLPELSMGMSGDLETAIEEGATIVRVGTAIFGARTV